MSVDDVGSYLVTLEVVDDDWVGDGTNIKRAKGKFKIVVNALDVPANAEVECTEDCDEEEEVFVFEFFANYNF